MEMYESDENDSRTAKSKNGIYVKGKKESFSIRKGMVLEIGLSTIMNADYGGKK